METVVDRAHEQDAPQPNYLAVFIVLVAVTAIEVTVSFVPFAQKTVQTLILVGLSFIKALLVVLFYMHLRYDARLYAIIIAVPALFGVLLALAFML